MVYQIPKILTADEIAAMSPQEKEDARIALESAMVAEAEHYRTNEEKRVAAQAKADAANSAFLDANKALFDELTEAKTEAKISHELLQSAAVARRLLSGDKSWEAFQAAETWEPIYDEKSMFEWVLYEAPRAIREKLLTLNTKAANAYVLTRINENGVPAPRQDDTLILPAIAKRSYTGRVMSQQLDAMIARLKPVSPPKMIEAVSDPVSIIVLDPTRILTQDAVAQALRDNMPTPASPMQPVQANDLQFPDTLKPGDKALVFQVVSGTWAIDTFVCWQNTNTAAFEQHNSVGRYQILPVDSPTVQFSVVEIITQPIEEPDEADKIPF